MTPADENELIADFQAGDLRSAAPLIRQFEGMIHTIVRPMVTPRADLDDLLQVGRDALLAAAKVHDPSLGKLSTHAYRRIEWCAQRYVKKQRHIVKGATSSAVARGREYTIEVSFDAPHPIFERATIGDSIAAPAEQESENVDQLVGILHGRDREVIERHFFDREETLGEIGASWGTSKEWTRQVKDRALDKMRRVATVSR